MNTLYTPNAQSPAYQLRYVWTGWSSQCTFPPEPPETFWKELKVQWQSDGIEMLEHYWQPDQIQILFSTKPSITPVFLASRAKGRLQHSLKKGGNTNIKFSRKLSVRSIGDAKRSQVEAYIAAQVKESEHADSRFTQKLHRLTRTFPEIDLKEPQSTKSGRYWSNLHLVLVVNNRDRLVEKESLEMIFSETVTCLGKLKCEIATLSVLPDHIHVALKTNLELSPQDIALKLQNDTSIALKSNQLWSPNYYVGTFSEYTMDSIRAGPRSWESSSPAGQADRGR